MEFAVGPEVIFGSLDSAESVFAISHSKERFQASRNPVGETITPMAYPTDDGGWGLLSRPETIATFSSSEG